nr:LOW QUALITY PROTEIN: uncharacterized protein LOC116770465 [Danaus plexippus plexippus]
MYESRRSSKLVSRTSYEDEKEEEEEEEESEEINFRWRNLIFLPFHPFFKGIVIYIVIIKTILGPINAVFPIIHCWKTPLYTFKFCYLYLCDPIIGIDTFLHILHRQVTDEAMRREYLPRSAFLLMLDLTSIIPFYQFVSEEICPKARLWPNILSFNELVIIYRVVESFSLFTTHNIVRMFCGFTILLAITVNGITCFVLLLTFDGLCKNCNDNYYDWRLYVLHKLNETDVSYSTYVYGISMILSHLINKQYDDIKPSTISEYVVIGFLIICGNLMLIFIIFPKMVAEALLKCRRFCTFYPEVHRIIEETKRHNPSPIAHIDVENFYTLMWKKHHGITSIPEVISQMPRYLRIDIKQDLIWPVFYHSPTLRKTSDAYKRWLCEYVHIDYKLPGQKFYAGPYCKTHLYYLKSGIVQLISCDDGVTPLISVTSGTIFGDISFYLPPSKRNVLTRCLTYCEVLYITRIDVLQSLHMFPEDRHLVLNHVKDRIKHSRILHTCKQHIRGLDRSEDEGIAWVKRRWWEICEAVNSWNKSSRREGDKCQLPAEESSYHCAKYIGQLVLCSNVQLNMKSMFANEKFPWIFVPDSKFGQIWGKIVTATVFFVMLFYPPYITRNDIPTWFKSFQLWTDFIYICDICVSLLTSIVRHENVSDNFASVMLARCKSTKFVLDLLSTVWIENLALISGLPHLYAACQFNRLIKIYMLFPKWNLKRDPLCHTCYKIALIHFAFVYIVSYFLFMIDRKNPSLTTSYFFGEVFCKSGVSDEKCDFEKGHPLNVVLAFSLEYLFYEYLPYTLVDIGTAMFISYFFFIIYIYCKSNLVAALYLKYREKCNYQYFVANIKHHYTHHKIHPKLLERLNRYLLCHWKYYNGMDVMHPHLLKNEPYDIYWKVHGELAEKIIKESQAFLFADTTLIRELAYKSRFLILAKNSTLILFGILCKNVSWVVQGSILSEYHNYAGELTSTIYGPGNLLTSFGVFFGTVSLRTLTAYTDCEILYIKIQDFLHIVKKYPSEWANLQICIEEFSPRIEALSQDYVTKHNKHHEEFRNQIFQNRHPNSSISDTTSIKTRGFAFLNPEGRFMLCWMRFRVMVVIISISASALQGGSGAYYRWPLMKLEDVCDFVATIDIFLKMFLAYYDTNGLLITSLPMSIKNYVTRGFAFDVIGCMPIVEVINLISTENIKENDAMLINTLGKYAHLYLVFGYFNYKADIPTINFTYVMILKWQVVTILLMLGTSQYFVYYCIDFKWDERAKLIEMKRQNHCWLPNFFPLNETPSSHQLHMVYAESLNLAQSGFMRLNLGKFQISREHLGLGVILLLLGFIFWYVICYSLTLLILNYRGNTIFQHAVGQLGKFLKAERVEDSLINRTKAHFRYWWVRTKGINIQNLMNERIGVVFRQDLSFTFYFRTVEATDTLLRGGETLERELASSATQLYFLPQEVIMREMDLNPWIFIVHRGKIAIKQNGEKLATLTKGSIFGQLEGLLPRPIRVTAVSEDFADILQLTIKEFQEMIDDKVRNNIKENPQSKLDFMAIKRIMLENPYNTVKYLLRGRKSIKLPWMDQPTNVHSSKWFHKWLYLVLLFNPVATSYIMLFAMIAPNEYVYIFFDYLLVLDFLHLVYIGTEFYSTALVVEHGMCVDRELKWRLFRKWHFYVDILSFILPILAHYFGYHIYELIRLIRLRLLYDFHRQFCEEFQSTVAPVLLKFTIVLFSLHCLTCGWIFVACREPEFPIELHPLPNSINQTVDYTEWTTPDKRIGGCARLTKGYIKNNKTNFGFLVPVYWAADYVVAMLYIIIIYTHTETDVVVALTLKQMYYKLLLHMIIYLAEIWILSVVISAIYTKYRELYAYDYDVINLIRYLKHSGLSPILLKSVKEYTNQLWKRQRGNWLPELAQQAPQCLREDLLGSLYLHHLLTTPLFSDLPVYFNRQLVARLQRVVIFPGKFIIREGDIFSVACFIHEGEVEKWYTDTNGEKKLHSVLSTNGFFGLIPCLFPNTPFQFSYFSRTVVDIVYLKHTDWQDLMWSYPEIKKNLYASATAYKKM